MALRLTGYIALPEHSRPGGFDHAAVHTARGRLYVAHTCNDALDVVDCVTDRYLHSISGLVGVAGALVSEDDDLLFTSNRGEDTVGVFAADDEARLTRVPVGIRPNGLAYAPERRVLLAAHVGDPGLPGSFTVSLIDVGLGARTADIPVPGRTRWAVYDAATDAFYVNIMEPAVIVGVRAADGSRVARTIEVPWAGPHGLDSDRASGCLYCACDAGQLVKLDTQSGIILGSAELAGVPDVIFLNVARRCVYVAVGDPGVLQVFDADTLKLGETVTTEKGAHTLGFDAIRQKVYAFMPETHRAAVFFHA